ncbi:hypothetical protein ACFL51_01925 [Myxococcota bacterium]
MTRRSPVIAAAMLFCLGSASANALPPCPPTPADDAEARRLASKWWRAAVKLFDSGSNMEAAKAWVCSNQLAPHPLALYNIARAAERAGTLAYALSHFKRFLAAMPITSKRSEVEAAIRRLERQLSGSPKPRRFEPLPRRVEPIPNPTPNMALQKPGRPGKGKRVAGWIGVGLGVALGGLAAAFGGLASNERSVVENADVGTAWNSDIRDHDKRFRSYRTGAYISAGVGAAALVTGTVLLILGYSTRRPERSTASTKTSTSVSVAPAIMPGGASLSLDLRF